MQTSCHAPPVSPGPTATRSPGSRGRWPGSPTPGVSARGRRRPAALTSCHFAPRGPDPARPRPGRSAAPLDPPGAPWYAPAPLDREHPLATRTRTVVFTDLANYTASVGRSDRESLRNLIASHEKLVAPVLEQHGGRIVKNLGDSFMALFPSATDAVRASLELVEAVREGSMNLRVGMATGDVEVIDGDAFGEAVNLASRIEGKTPEGEVWFTRATLLCMNQAEIAWDRVGAMELKGITGDVELFRAVPRSRSYLPEPVREAVLAGRLVRHTQGDPLPSLPPDPVLLLEGFTPGSPALRALVDRLPVIDPSGIWLQAYTLPPIDRHAWTQAGHGLVIGTPGAVQAALLEVHRPRRSVGSETIILDMGAAAEFELVVAGLALPSVPMSDVVASYTYDLLADGRWVNRSDAAVARVEVGAQGVLVRPLAPGVELRGRQTRGADPAMLADGDVLVAPGGPVVFQALHAGSYAGLLLSDTVGRLAVAPGQRAEIGREPEYPGLALPDRKGQDNIRWCVGPRAARARQNGFTLDRALAGRHQCAFEPGSMGTTLVSLHDRCPTFLVRGAQLELVPSRAPVGSGDLVVVGTTVIAVRSPEA